MEELRRICIKTYQDFVRDLVFIPTELKRALKTHERVPVFIDNLVREFSMPGLKVKRETIEQAVRDMSLLFLNAVRVKHEERIMSPMQRALKKAAADRKEEMRKLSDALDAQGVEHVTQDKAGNQTSRQTAVIDDAFNA